MRFRLIFAAAAALTLIACNDASTTPRITPTTPTRDIECRSGYHIATRADGSEACVEDGGASFSPTSPSDTTPPAIELPAPNP